MFLATLARQGWDKQEVHRGQIDMRKSAVSDRSATGMYVHMASRCKEEREVTDAKGRNIHYSGEKYHKSRWVTYVWFTHSLKIHCIKAHHHVLASCALSRNSKKKKKLLLVFVFQRKNCLRGFSVVRAVQLLHAEDKIMLVSSVSGCHKCDRWMVHTPEVPRSMWKCCVISCPICTLCQAHAEARKTRFS